MSQARVFIGDARDVVLTTGRKYRFLLADPPYSRAGAAHTSTTNAAGKHAVLAASDQFWGFWFRDQLSVVLAACERYACGMVFCDYRTVAAIEKAVIGCENGWAMTQCAVWDRGSIGLGSPMRARHELIAFLRGPSFSWEGRKDIANVFNVPWPYGSHPNHPAEKPVSLLRRLIEDFGQGGPVIDPFCGSGSSGVAAKEAGVAWDGIELDGATAAIAAERTGQRVRLFQDTVARRIPGEPYVYLMNRQKRGFGESAVRHRSVEEIEALYHVSVGEWGRDEHSEMANVTLNKP